MLWGRSKLKNKLLVLQQQLSDNTSILLASLCVEIAQHSIAFQRNDDDGDEDDQGEDSQTLQAKLSEAHHYLFGTDKSGKQNVQAAIKAYTIAAERGSAKAMLYLAHIYNKGRGLLPGDDDSAFFVSHPFTAQLKHDPLLYRQWLEKAALFGSIPAMTELGLLLMSEVVDADNDEEADISKNNNHGLGRGTMTMASMARPKFKNRHLEEISRMLDTLESQSERAIEADRESTSSPSKAPSIKSIKTMLQRTKTMEEMGRATSKAFISQQRQQEPELPKPSSIKKLFQRTGSFGLTRTSNTATSNLQASSRSLPDNKKLKRGLAMLFLAAKNGHPPAQIGLGNIYHAVSRESDAFQSYQRAAMQNDASGQNMMGICYCKGIGVEEVSWAGTCL